MPQFDWAYITAALELQSNYQLEAYLTELGCSVDRIVDSQGLTLLHQAVLNGAANKVKFVLDLAKNDSSLNDLRIVAWVNARSSEEEWTALHYACFTQSLESIYLLI